MFSSNEHLMFTIWVGDWSFLQFTVSNQDYVRVEPKIIATSKSPHHADRARKNYVGEQAVPKFNVQESNQINTLFQICCFQNVVNCSNYLQTRHNLNEIKDLDMQTVAMKKKILQMLLNGPHSDFSGTDIASWC